MSKKINYDFKLSNSVAVELEEIVSSIDNEIIRFADDDIALISSAWKSETSERFILKYKKLLEEIKQTGNEIIAEAEQIKKISQHMFLIEQEAKRITCEEGQ